jgi:transposase
VTMLKKKIGLKINRTHGFTPKQLRKLERKTKHVDDRIRVTAVRLIMEGYMTIQVAELLNIARQTVSIYVRNFESGGIELLLKRKPFPGKKSFLTEEEQLKLKEIVIKKHPFDYDISQSANWTVKTIREVIEQQFSVSMSQEGVRKLLIRLGFSHTRATYVLEKASEEKQRAFQKEVDMIQNLVKKTY